MIKLSSDLNIYTVWLHVARYIGMFAGCGKRSPAEESLSEETGSLQGK